MSSKVPKGWLNNTLGHFINRAQGGGTPSRDCPAYWSGDIPWASVKDISSGHAMPEETITKQGLENSSSHLISAGTNILATRMAVGSVARYELDVAINQDLVALVPDKSLDQSFLFYWLTANSEQFKAVATGTTVKGLRREVLLSWPMLLPPLDEQRRIAEVLRSVDEAILVSIKVCAQHRNLIQREIDSAISRLVADEAIETVTLGQIAQVKGGKRLPKGSRYEDLPTGNPYIRVTNWSDYKISSSDVLWISDEVASAIKRYTISTNDLFISIAGSVGLVAFVPPELDGAYLTENAAKIIISKKDVVGSGFLLVALRSGFLRSQIHQQKGVGGGVPKLALFRIGNLVLPLPPIEKQREISAYYFALEAAEVRATATLNAWKSVRDHLATDLLSGSVRVPA